MAGGRLAEGAAKKLGVGREVGVPKRRVAAGGDNGHKIGDDSRMLIQILTSKMEKTAIRGTEELFVVGLQSTMVGGDTFVMTRDTFASSIRRRMVGGKPVGRGWWV